LRAARNLIRRREPNKIFSQIKEDFTLLTKESNEEAAQRIREYFKELAKKELEGKTPKDAEALSDLIDAIESIGKARVFETLLIKTEKGDLTDLTDNRTLSCCAFYPDGANKEASIYYLKDPEIGLLWIKSATYQGEELDNLGVAIMVNCQDKEGNKVLLIDSVEGGEALERSGIEWKEKMLESIKKIAEENKQKYIVFNLNVTNETPKRFNRFLGEKKIKEGKIYLEKINGVEAIKEWNDKHYLEAFGGWQFPKGEVKGYKIEVEKEK
jgi:DNA repair photolyase